MEETETSAPIMQDTGIHALIWQKIGCAEDWILCSRLAKRQEPLFLVTRRLEPLFLVTQETGIDRLGHLCYG
jgi:hypothetical protein